MTYREFCDELAPIVVDLQNECKKMTEEDFNSFREKVLLEIQKNQSSISDKFMVAVFDMIHNNIFKAA